MSATPILDALRRHYEAGRLGDPTQHLVDLFAKTPGHETIIRALCQQVADQAVKRARHRLPLIPFGAKEPVNAIAGPTTATPRGVR